MTNEPWTVHVDTETDEARALIRSVWVEWLDQHPQIAELIPVEMFDAWLAEERAAAWDQGRAHLASQATYELSSLYGQGAAAEVLRDEIAPDVFSLDAEPSNENPYRKEQP